MFKRLLVLILSLLLIGCAGRPKTVDIPVGDYTGTIPSSWKEKDGYYYCGKVGRPPYMFISVDSGLELSELVSDSDSFVDGFVEEFGGQLLADFMPVSSFDYPAYVCTIAAEVDGVDTHNIIYCLGNPSGGTIFIGFMDINDNSNNYDNFIKMMENLK